MAESTDVVVVGAGPGGLAVGACLKKAGLNFIILEGTPGRLVMAPPLRAPAFAYGQTIFLAAVPAVP